MSNPGEEDPTPITSARQLADYIAAGCKPASAFRIGTEHEKFGFFQPGGAEPAYAPPPYAPHGIGAVLDRLAPGATEIRDHGALIGLTHGGASISLEPAGQFELSGAPLATLHDTRAELDAHFAALRDAAAPLGIGFAPLGFHPTATRAQMPWMPKSRYAIMRRYMPEVGTRGLDMMTRTCTVQVNLDYSSEADMAAKLRVALALQPVATALFANSPFVEGRPNGLLSNRAEVWRDTDNARSGIPAAMLEPGFGFERYVEWLLDVPMYFVSRDGEYVDLAGASFRDFMAGRLASLPGERARVGDFADHMTTAFTDVRLKRFLEMRGADAGTPAMMLAQCALWVGLLYNGAALAAASALVGDMTQDEIIALRDTVPRLGLDAHWRGTTVRRLAHETIEIAAAGLASRRHLGPDGQDEAVYLDPLRALTAGGPTQAEQWLQRYHSAWGGDASRIFPEAAV